jgi:hypothetical protein
MCACTHMHESPTAEHANGGEPVMVRGCLFEELKFNKHGSIFVLFDKKFSILD